MAKRWAIGSFGAAMALRKKAKTTLFQTDVPRVLPERAAVQGISE